VVVGDIEFENRRFEATDYVVTDQEWYRSGLQADEPRWFNVSHHPVGARPSIAYAGPVDVYEKRQGVLAIIIEYTRFAQFLSNLSVGQSGAAFILGRDGSVIAAPDPDADELKMQRSDQPLLPIAQGAMKQAGSSYDADKGIARPVRLVVAGNAYAVSLTPLTFPGWTLATVIPEAEFLGPVERTIRQLLIGLVVLILVAGIVSAWLARRVIATPLIVVVDELKHVARFDLDKVRRHASHLIEIENLSNAIADMAGGLAAFRKYIPSDLVKALVSEGIEPSPGGSIRNLTVLFSDIAGFTGLSERDGLLGRACGQCRSRRRCLPRGTRLPARPPGVRTDRRRRPTAPGAGRHQFRRHAGRQYRIGPPAQLHGDRRRREYRQPARRCQ
jgi:adenylate cyclase